MNNKTKVLLSFLGVLIIVLAGLLIYRMLFSSKPVIKDITIEGTIEEVNDNYILVKELQFNTKDNFNINDKVRITYNPEDKKNDIYQNAKIELIEKAAIKEDKVQTIIDNMTLEEKVGQMFFVNCPDGDVASIITQYQFGGIIMFDKDIKPYTKPQFIANNENYQSVSKIPLLIGADEEGGTVIRFSRYENYRSTPFLSPQQLYNQGGLDAITADTSEKDQLLLSIGVNVNFAPVSDVSTNPNDFINARAFGKDANATSTFVTTVINQMKSDKEGSVLKHFPGYGNNTDTHTGSATDNRDLNTFETSDFLPFKAGIEAGADSVLVNHNVVNAFDNTAPASLSKAVHDKLRNELKFNGVIMTDDLAMEAITDYCGDDQAAIYAVNAGNDMLLTKDYELQFNTLLTAVKNGSISEDRINESVKRIIQWKINLGLIK